MIISLVLLAAFPAAVSTLGAIGILLLGFALIVFVILLAGWLTPKPVVEHIPAKVIEETKASVEVVEAPADVVEPVAEAVQAVEEPFEFRQDDLQIIEGIGPKTSSILKDAGITTFDKLANTDVATLEGLLRAAGLRLGDPTSWPDQARLAANGEMEALSELQKRLTGGR